MMTETNKYTKEYINGLLSEGEITVKFTKKDGTERLMRCTKNFDKIPQEFHPKADSEKKESTTDAIPVFDVEANGWRSFNLSNVLEVIH